MSSEPSKRDRILHAAMCEFMEHGFAAATTLKIASRASVSKRELYALVGNKEEMLATCIAERGGRMRLPEGFAAPTDRASLKAALQRYGSTMLRELTDPDVIGVFRLGIAEVKRSPSIARSLDAKGRQAANAALEAILRAARASRLLRDGDLRRMMSHYGGLLWGDLLVWILLGIEKSPSAAEIERRAEDAASIFLEAHGRR
jgi:AcrR family transcriptional regulator